jgi:spore germination cell wall hydrolase CwlJ-like protein
MGFLTVFSMGLTSYIVIINHYETRAIKCLALNIYHEARGESVKGQTAVATVTMNRVHSKKYPNDVCRVVFQKNWSRKYKRLVSHFSWTNFDDINSIIPKEDKAWYVALGISENVYKHNTKSNLSKDVLHYHATYVKPKWAKNKKVIAKIGHHVFYQ